MAASVSRSSSSTAVTKNCPHRSFGPSSIASTGGNIALPPSRLVGRRDQQAAVARIDGADNRLARGAVGAEALRELGKPGVGADHRAAAFDGRNRHRGMIEEENKEHFGAA